MADSYYDIAQELRKKPGIRLLSKGTTWDRVYVEQDTASTSREHPRYPQSARDKWPAKYQPGSKHPKCKWLTLIDAYISGGDDHKQNWTLIYQLDIRAFHAAYPSISTTWEALLAKDGAFTTYPAQDDSAEVTWTFTIINPDTYTRAAQGAVHPLIENCLLISEQSQRDGLTLTVTRVYHKVAPLTAQSKIGYTITGEYAGFNIVTWSYETRNQDYTAPDTNTSCPIAGYTALKVIKPADIENLNTENLRVTLTYGALPGPDIAVPVAGEGPAGDIIQHSQRRAVADGNHTGPYLSFQTSDDNGYSKTWNWITLTSSPVFRDYDLDQETRSPIQITRQIVAVTGVPDDDKPPQSVGGIGTQQQINQFYAMRTRRSILTESELPAGYRMRQWIDFRIPSVVPPGGITGAPSTDGLSWRVGIVSRGGYMKKLRGYVDVTFHNSLPEAQSIYQIIPSNQVYNGEFFGFNLTGRLVDAQTVGSSGGTYSELVNVVGTSPTASQYISDVSGPEQRIAEETVRYWTGHFKRSSIYVKLEI